MATSSPSWLQPGTDARAAKEVAARLVAVLVEPFPLDDVTPHLEASVGIGLCPQHCDHPMLLLQRADVAMYAAKRARGHVAFYRPEDDRTAGPGCRWWRRSAAP